MKSKTTKKTKTSGECCGGGCGCGKKGQSTEQAPFQQDALILAQVQSQVAQANISTLMQVLNLVHNDGNGQYRYVIDDSNMRDTVKAGIAENVALVARSVMLLQ
jgi:hypothetical protein